LFDCPFLVANRWLGYTTNDNVELWDFRQRIFSQKTHLKTIINYFKSRKINHLPHISVYLELGDEVGKECGRCGTTDGRGSRWFCEKKWYGIAHILVDIDKRLIKI
jgi:hypothetical protein